MQRKAAMKFGCQCLLALCLLALPSSLASLPLQAQRPEVPAAASPSPVAARPAYRLPPDKLAEAVALSRIRITLGVAGALWSLAFLWLLLATRGWAAIERWTQRAASREWVRSLMFFAGFFLVTTLAAMPLDVAAHHFERAYGISVQGWSSWLCDQAKGLGITLLCGTPILLLFHRIVRRWPRRYWLVAWFVTLPLLALMVFVEPLAEPLFYQFEPLQKNHAALVAELENVVARTGTGIPPARMYLMQAGVKSNGLNAYVSGLGATKRIVVWDTTAGRIPNDEVLFIFGHESGHYVLHHIAKGIAASALGLFFVYWTCSAFASWLIGRYGTRWGANDLGSRTGFVVLLFAVSFAMFLTEPVANAVSRHFEHQADIYGQEAIHGIVADPQKTAVAAFNDLGVAWLEDPHPNPFLVFWLYDHPSIQQRAEFAAHYNPWANGGRGRFFSK
jgi:STE24 endopeptidase